MARSRLPAAGAGNAGRPGRPHHCLLRGVPDPFFRRGCADFFPPFVASIPLVVGARSPPSTGQANTGCPGAPRCATSSPARQGLTLGMVLAMMIVLTLYRFEGFSRGVFAIEPGDLLGAARGHAGGDERASALFAAPTHAAHSTLIYGAGGGGKLVLRELSSEPRASPGSGGLFGRRPGKRRTRSMAFPCSAARTTWNRRGGEARGRADHQRGQIDTERIDAIRERCAPGDQGAADALKSTSCARPRRCCGERRKPADSHSCHQLHDSAAQIAQQGISEPDRLMSWNASADCRGDGWPGRRDRRSRLRPPSS